MYRIATAPRTSRTHLTLQADYETWEKAQLFLISTGMGAFTGTIDAYLRGAENTEKIIRITFPEEVARTILRHLGLSA